MYSDVVNFDNEEFTFYLDIIGDKEYNSYDECYLTAVFDQDTGMPAGFEVSAAVYSGDLRECSLDGAYLPY